MASVIRGNDNFDSSSVGPSTSLGAVGTYAFIYYATNSTPGTTVAGSSLQYANTVGHDNNGSSGISPSGTWRLMGSVGYFNGGNVTNSIGYKMTVAVRIS